MLGLFSLACMLAVAGLAQISTANLAGTITDESGGVIRNAEMTLASANTGTRRVTHSDSSGRYNFEQLPPDAYRLTAQLAGFQTEVAPKIELTVGRKASLDLRLKVGEVKTETIVSDGAELVATRDSSLSIVMESTAIHELPLNGRDFAQLALLQPGVVPSMRTADSGGPGTKLVIEGNRPSQVSFLMDGSDINDASNNTPGSAAGFLIGVDTLQEFRVVTNAYSAEYGRASGGVLSTVTKSGTNTLHGSLFEFVRNNDLDAKNYFDSKTAPIPAFKRNQFGVEADGPIFKNKTFFLGSFEAVRQRLGVTTVSIVPDANARVGNIPGQPKINVDPSVPGYLALVPLPNGRAFGDGTRQYTTSASQPTDETFFAGRIDHRLSDATSLFARFTYDTAISSVPDGFNLSRADGRSLNHYLTLGATHTFSEHLLDTLRVSSNRSYTANDIFFMRSVDPSLAFLPGQPLGQISLTGLFSLGPSRFNPSSSTFNLYQFSNDLSYTFGRHSLKIGADYRFYKLPTIRPQSPYGFYQFSSLVNFLTAKASSVEMTLPSSTLARHWRQSMTRIAVEPRAMCPIRRSFCVISSEREKRLERQPQQTLEAMLADSPTQCEISAKATKNGQEQYWRGYKLHLDVADGQIPISAILTSASVHDSQVAIPLMTLSGQRVDYLYELMDSAYDANHIHAHSSKLNHVAIIAPHSRRGTKQPSQLPKVRPTRLAPELTPAQKDRFKERTMVERVYSRLKDEFGANQVRVRGAAKVMTHLMFGVLALAVDQWLRILK